jgi:serine/threonine protein kinase
MRSTSGKSQIWSAYKSNDGETPTGNRLTIKVSPYEEAMIRENKNYNRIARGLLGKKPMFIAKLDFYKELSDSGSGFDGFSALVLEAGSRDLKSLLAQHRPGQGFSGRAMRDLAAAAGQCIEAVHSSGMIWTDLKTENFVIVDETTDFDSMQDSDGLKGIKAIDLESAMPIRSNPVDYSPEACPPEFARSFLNGEGEEFVLEKSYDLWSLGMMLYELSTGRAYFEGRTPLVITRTLRQEDFEPDVSAVQDDKLRDLISQCMQLDPRKRPNIALFLLHPYFITTGVGPFSF